MAMSSQTAKTVALILVMLVTGSYNTLNTKLAFQTCAPTWDAATLQPGGHDGCPAGQTKFNKPWLNNIFMFVGEASLMLVYTASRLRANGGRTLQASGSAAAAVGASPFTADQGLLAPPARQTPFYIFAIPAFCDVFGTGLAAVGMLYMDSAIWQMLRSSIIIFSAILSVIFLKRRLQPFHWVATVIVFIGLVTVGLASLLDGSVNTSATPTQQVLGIALVVGAQICSAFQMVFEEKLLTGRVKTSAKKVVGMEGLWGGLFMVIILTLMSTLPGSDDGHYESTPEGLHMLANSPFLLALVPTYMCSIAVYNLTGIVVGKRMSAVVRCLVDSCRTVVVWAMNLFIYYFISQDFGSAWMPHSWLTALGFLLLIFGTLLYNEVLPVPAWLARAPAPAEEDEDGSMISRSHTGLDDVLAKVDLTEEEGEASCAREAIARCAA